MQIKILGRHTSYNVQKVLWLADELELQYEHTELGGSFGGTDTADFLALNPIGKVPVLIFGDQPITESNTIIRFLADHYAPNQWIATDALERTVVNRWLDWSIDRLEPAFVEVFWGYYRQPADQRDWPAINKGIQNTAYCLNVLAKQLADNPFLSGQTITLADICTGVYLHRLKHIDLNIEFPDAVQNWYKRLSERPAYQKWGMSDFTSLQGRSEY